jgi:hypothetical protein
MTFEYELREARGRTMEQVPDFLKTDVDNLNGNVYGKPIICSGCSKPIFFRPSWYWIIETRDKYCGIRFYMSKRKLIGNGRHVLPICWSCQRILHDYMKDYIETEPLRIMDDVYKIILCNNLNKGGSQ